VGDFNVLKGNWNLKYFSEFQNSFFGGGVSLLGNAMNFQ